MLRQYNDVLKYITGFLIVALGIVTHAAHSDGNKLVVFSGIVLYYGDTYIVSGFQAWKLTLALSDSTNFLSISCMLLCDTRLESVYTTS